MRPEHTVKYPRTPHLPWSPGRSDDDLGWDTLDTFKDQEIVITEKMDGENSTLYRDYLHARSLDSRHHPSRSWLKNFHQQIALHIPPGWRLCGENLYAKHAIFYDKLDSYFMLFSIWDAENHALSWDETLEWAELIGLSTPAVLWRGSWDEAKVRALHHNLDLDHQEGYVARTTAGFALDAFSAHVAKWVRPSHVRTDVHWMHAEIVPNQLTVTSPSSAPHSDPDASEEPTP